MKHTNLIMQNTQKYFAIISIVLTRNIMRKRIPKHSREQCKLVQFFWKTILHTSQKLFKFFMSFHW